MTEFEVSAKDYIKLGFLSEVTEQKNVVFNVYLESDGIEKNFLDIRTDKNVYRFNNFNVSEDATRNTITFRPIVIGCYSYFRINSLAPLTLAVIKNGTTTVARQFVLQTGDNKIEFVPQGLSKYVMKIEENEMPADSSVMPEAPPAPSEDSSVTPEAPPIYAEDPAYAEKKEQLLQSHSGLEADIREIQKEIADLEAKNGQLVNNKNHLMSHLEKLQAEYDKDYASYEADMEEIKSKYTIDDEILKMYADKEVTPIEELIARCENDIKEMEEQARIFIEARQRKTADIENELKIGKKE
ncbi:MAG: hypothetical protein HFH14_01750 [Lachnospiraceae bacterium]|nr:hypothetical protein [Lachnospiraceae bacterium]